MAARFLEDRPAAQRGPAPGRDPRRPIAPTRRPASPSCSSSPRSTTATAGAHPGARARAGRAGPARRRRPAGRRGVPARIPASSTREGIMLMCLAEALLRIPDAETADRLIRDKLSAGEWSRHLGRSGSLLVNASTWGLMLTGRVVRVEPRAGGRPGRVADAPAAAPRRAGPAPGAAPGDARARPPLRARPDHRAGDQAGARGRTQGLSLLLRHAGRGRPHRRRRRALSPRLSRRDRRDRRGRAGRRPDGAAGHLDQALGAASALRAGAAPPPARRAVSPRARAPPERRAPATSRSPSTPRRPIAWSRRSTCSSGSPPRRSWPAGTGSASRSRPIRSGRSM